VTDERYLWRLRRAAERLGRLVQQFEDGTCDAVELLAIEGHLGMLTYELNLANMKAARRPEDHHETESLATGRAVALRRAS
jgi:hypothetical protein